MPHARAADASQGSDRQLHRRLEARPEQRAGAPRTRPLSDQRAAGRQGAAGPLQARKLGADPVGVAYHLSLAYYVTGDFKRAAEEYEQCYPNAKTDDNRVGCLAWQYVALLRAGRKTDADKVLERITPDTNVQSSVALSQPAAAVQGRQEEEEVAQAMQKDNLQLPTVAYGVGVWHLVNGRQDRAREYFEKATAPPAQQSGFGSVASYYELQRMKQ